MYAILSDIHANLEALEAVLRDIKEQGIQAIYCLGDMVGYGPNPAECVELAMQFDLVLMGNHDEAVLGEAMGFNPLARGSVDWTRKQLKPGLFSSAAKKRRWEFLQKLPRTHTIGEDVLLVHASPRDPTMEYVLRGDCETLVDEVPPKLRDIFSRFRRLCFIGHTHDPGLITERAEFVALGDCGGEYRVPEGEKLLANVGSVGQPRDADPRACYVTVEEGPPRGELVLRYHRVAYELEKTQRKIRAISHLDPRIADRLAEGK